MNVSNVASMATSIASKQSAINVDVERANIANINAEMQGAGKLQLIESAAQVSKPHGSLGHNINTTA